MTLQQIRLHGACTQDDFTLCADIWLAASLEAHSFISSQFWIAQYSLMRDVYLPASAVRLAYYGQTLSGFSAVCGSTLAALFVHPAQWGKGIGSLLLAELRKEHEQLDLTVYTQNTRATSFYSRNGFIIHNEQACPRTGKQEYCMTWTNKGGQNVGGAVS